MIYLVDIRRRYFYSSSGDVENMGPSRSYKFVRKGLVHGLVSYERLQLVMECIAFGNERWSTDC